VERSLAGKPEETGRITSTLSTVNVIKRKLNVLEKSRGPQRACRHTTWGPRNPGWRSII